MAWLAAALWRGVVCHGVDLLTRVFRARRVEGEGLALETVFHEEYDGRSLSRARDRAPCVRSDGWLPLRSCLDQMLAVFLAVLLRPAAP